MPPPPLSCLFRPSAPNSAISRLLGLLSSPSFPAPETLARLISSAKLASAPVPLGHSLHCLALKLGFLDCLPVPNSLIHLYASSDALDDARQLFDELPQRDTVTYNSLADGYVKAGDLVEAERLFWDTPERSVVSWSCLFNGFVKNRKFHQGMRFYSRMREHGVEPDDTTVVTLLNVYAHYKFKLFGKLVHAFLLRRWLCMPVHVSSALIDFYCKCGVLDGALALFERIEKKDLICWNTAISGLGSHGRGEAALCVFAEMLEEDGVKPDDITFIGVLVSCAHSGLVEQGLKYFEMMSSRFGIVPSFAHYWCLVDLYVRKGSSDDALKVIQRMLSSNPCAVWAAVIWLARVCGDVSVGEYLGRRLIELEPYNSRRYLPLAIIYAATSRWDKYEELRMFMKAMKLKKLPDCTLIDMNVLVHKFSVGDERQSEIGSICHVLEETKKKLNLQHFAEC